MMMQSEHIGSQSISLDMNLDYCPRQVVIIRKGLLPDILLATWESPDRCPAPVYASSRPLIGLGDLDLKLDNRALEIWSEP